MISTIRALLDANPEVSGEKRDDQVSCSFTFLFTRSFLNTSVLAGFDILTEADVMKVIRTMATK